MRLVCHAHLCLYESHIRLVLSTSQFQSHLISNYHSQLIHLMHSFLFLKKFPLWVYFLSFSLLTKIQNKKKTKKNWPTKQLTHLIYDVFEYMLQYHGLSCSSCVSTIWGVVYFIHSLLQFSTLNFLLHKLFTTLSP